METKLSDKLTPQSRELVELMAWFRSAWTALGIGIGEWILYHITLPVEIANAIPIQLYLFVSLFVPASIMLFCLHKFSKSTDKRWAELFQELRQHGKSA